MPLHAFLIFTHSLFAQGQSDIQHAEVYSPAHEPEVTTHIQNTCGLTAVVDSHRVVSDVGESSVHMQSTCERSFATVSDCVCPACAAACFSPESTEDVTADVCAPSCVQDKSVHTENSSVPSCDHEQSHEHVQHENVQHQSKPLYVPPVPVTECICPACGTSFRNLLPLLPPVTALHVAWQSYQAHFPDFLYVRSVPEATASYEHERATSHERKNPRTPTPPLYDISESE